MSRFICFLFILIFVISICQFILIGNVSTTSISDLLSTIQNVTDDVSLNEWNTFTSSWFLTSADWISSNLQGIPVISTLVNVFSDVFKVLIFLASGIRHLVDFIIAVIMSLL